ncbi:hypothetical protein KQI84_14550 [bacterium]|nr:hypothetical protein [bacterium]
MAIEDSELYQETGKTWRYFGSWRDKSFAGYLTALAGVALAYSRYDAAPIRTGLFAAVIVISIVFWAFEHRSRMLMNACQLAADKIENGRGCYNRLNKTRYSGGFLLTYGMGVNLLVALIISMAVLGLVAYWPVWCGADPWKCLLATAVLPLMVFSLVTLMHRGLHKPHEEQRKDFAQLASERPPSAPK